MLIVVGKPENRGLPSSFPSILSTTLQRKKNKKFVDIPEKYSKFEEHRSFQPTSEENNDTNSLAVLQYTGGTTGGTKGGYALKQEPSL